MATKRNNLTIEQILAGTAFGRPQSVGHMEVIPLIPESGDAVDDSFAPPNISASTRGYGNVRLSNEDPNKPTIAPMGTGWVTSQMAQDHAIASAEFIPAKSTKSVDTAMCIQRTQGGYIQNAKEFLILPVTLRTTALAIRKDVSYSKLWPAISSFNKGLGVGDDGGHLVLFLDRFKHQLDEFVAEFELVPDQIGAIILVGGQVVGIERAPNPAFWNSLWKPLIRVCYGSAALQARQVLGDVPAKHRAPLTVKDKSLAGIAAALAESRKKSDGFLGLAVDSVRSMELLTGERDRKHGDYTLLTIANPKFAGQMVENANGQVPYLSVGISALK